jgi:hypothetical protein
MKNYRARLHDLVRHKPLPGALFHYVQRQGDPPFYQFHSSYSCHFLFCPFVDPSHSRARSTSSAPGATAAPKPRAGESPLRRATSREPTSWTYRQTRIRLPLDPPRFPRRLIIGCGLPRMYPQPSSLTPQDIQPVGF